MARSARDGSSSTPPLGGRKQPGLPDGLKTDKTGHVFASGPGGIHVFRLPASGSERSTSARESRIAAGAATAASSISRPTRFFAGCRPVPKAAAGVAVQAPVAGNRNRGRAVQESARPVVQSLSGSTIFGPCRFDEIARQQPRRFAMPIRVACPKCRKQFKAPFAFVSFRFGYAVFFLFLFFSLLG